MVERCDPVSTSMTTSGSMAIGIQFFLSIFFGIIVAFLGQDWIAGLTVPVLWLIWRLAPRHQGPPALGLALTYQWLQISIALVYFAFTGRRLHSMDTVDYRPMVILGLM